MWERIKRSKGLNGLRIKYLRSYKWKNSNRGHKNYKKIKYKKKKKKKKKGVSLMWVISGGLNFSSKKKKKKREG